MLVRLSAALFAAFPALCPVLAWGAGNEIPPPAVAPDTHAQDSQSFSEDTPIEKLAANPAAAAIVDRYMPSLLEDPRYPMFKSMSLKTVAAMSGGRISAETLSIVDTELKAMPSATNAALR